MIEINSAHFYIAIILSLINAGILCFVAYKFFQSIQLAGYKINGYFEWLKITRGNYLNRLLSLSLLSSLGLLVTGAIFMSLGGEYWGYLGLAFYFIFAGVFIKYVYERPDKVPLKYTNRMTRYVIMFYIVSAIITFLLINLFSNIPNVFRYVVVPLTPLLVPVFTILVHFICYPMEELIRVGYIKKTKRIINKLPNLKTIAITGSYGKTSTKFILKTLLEQKYTVLATPSSFNTPMGITKTVNKYMNESFDYFIAEYGANSVGDIKYLCNIIKPNISVLLNIGNQHLATFKNEENIAKTKYEIIENIKKDGLAIFNCTDEKVKELSKNYNGKKLLVTENDNRIKFEDIKVSSSGTTLNLIIDGKTEKVSFVLLGEHNINNLRVAVFIADKLGLNIKEIKSGIEKIKPTKHRLEIVKSDSGITILDDSYNANIRGVKYALDVLGLFNGDKVLLTPGIVELGEEQFEANINFGKLASKVCKKVIIVNKINCEAIKKGLLDNGFNSKDIYYFDTLLEAQVDFQKLLKRGDILLIENDLPDNYV